MRKTIRTFGQLNCHVVEPATSKPDRAVLLCHGFGAGGDDLVALASDLCTRVPAARERVRFVFPEASLVLGDMGFGLARAWWMIDMQEMVERRSGTAEALRRYQDEVPEGIVGARRLVHGALDALVAEGGLGIGDVVLGGFSQGAMVTTDLALRLEEPPAALWALSGTLIAAPEWKRLASRRAGLQVVQSHGTADPILPFSGAEALRDLLGEAGLQVDFVPFNGEHTIPGVALERIATSLEAVLGRD